MNNFFHFGDSYATVGEFALTKHFCGIIADNIGYTYRAYGRGGRSNEQILNDIIKLFDTFKKNDIVFINFSFFTRGCWYNKTENRIQSTNVFFDDNSQNKTKLPINNENLLYLLEYYIKNSEDYAKKIFTLFNSVLENLERKNIKIFYIFVQETEYSSDLLKVGTNIQFEGGFSKWLKSNNFHNGTDVHYTNGIQPILADIILKITNKLNTTNSVLNVANDYIDINKIIKYNKLI